MRRKLRKLFKAAGYLLFLLLFVEVALQGFYYLTAGALLFSRSGPPMYAPDEHAGYRLKPNLDVEHNTNEFRTRIYTNSRGFRVSKAREEFPYRKDPGSCRVLLLGPSFAFGWAVDFEDSLAARLERLLEEGGYGGGRKVELINAGVPGQGPWQLMNWYDHEGHKYAPDLVIQLLYGSMVLPRPSGGAPVIDAEGNLVRQDTGLRRELQHRLKKSALVFYSWMLYARLGGGGKEEVLGAGRELETVAAFDLADPRIRDSLEYYSSMAHTVARRGARLLFVYFPLAYCVHPEDAPRWRHLGVRDISAQMALDSRFCGHLGELGIDCLDITPDLVAEAQRGERLYYWLDIHWTPRGNRVAAEAVAGHLAVERTH